MTVESGFAMPASMSITVTWVQPHIDEDHMEDFDSSKGFQKIFLSDETRRLLINEKNANLPIRDNIIALDPGVPFDVDGCQLSPLPSGHMLGAVQIWWNCPAAPGSGILVILDGPVRK
jgi:hypothetical protein